MCPGNNFVFSVKTSHLKYSVLEKKSLRHSALLRWLVLVLISALLFSTYWFYDFFSGIKGLMTAELGISSEEYGRILAATTFANMLGMILVGGLILDRWGIRIAGLVFGALAFLGALVTAFSLMGWFGSDKETMVWGAMGGRVLFGIGMEISCVVITRTIVKWFKGYEMALAMAVNIGFGRLGTALGMAVSPDLAGGTVAPAVNFAVVLIGISLILFVLYLFFDLRLDRQEGKVVPEAAEDERFRLADFLQLITNRSFIYITLLCVAFYAAVFPLLQYTPDLLVNKFGFSYALQGGDDFLLRSEEHTSELQSCPHLVCRLLLEKKKKTRATRGYNPRRATCARRVLLHDARDGPPHG